MPFKETKTLSCWECKELKKESEMAAWTSKGWRCSRCYNDELAYLREERKADNEMRIMANRLYYRRLPKDFDLREHIKGFKGWKWVVFWDYVNECRKQEDLLRETTTAKRITQQEPILLPIQEEEKEEEYLPWEEEEAITYLESLPTPERVKWSEVEF